MRLNASNGRALRCADTSIHLVVIDDDVDEDNPLVRSLHEDGFDVRCARTGAEGLKRIAENPPGVIVVDLYLPDMLGITVMSELRRTHVDAPIIAMTGYYLDTGHEEAAMALGAAGFMRKPVFSGELASLLRSAIATHVSENPSRSSPQTKATSRRSDCNRPAAIDADLTVLHGRFIDGDTAAFDQICGLLSRRLAVALSGRFRSASADHIHDAVVGAIIDYRSAPSKYDSTRGASLVQWLLLPAKRNLLNRLRAERARTRREVAAVEEQLLFGRVAEPDAMFRKLDLRKVLRSVLVEFTANERAMLRLWVRGERRTPTLAAAAGLSHVGIADQRLGLKRVKDRLVQSLRRSQGTKSHG
jgi:FixJ family two-component response regulator/DNA-directed RNA polymerase specialized sigma24 family protein